MGEDAKRTATPLWLTIALAASCAVVGYRLAGGILEILDPWLARVPHAWIISPREPKGLLFDLIGTGVAMALAVEVVMKFRNRSVRAHAVALCLFLIFAIFPLRVHVSVHPVEFPPAAQPVPAKVKPVALKMVVIKGEEIGSTVVISESNVDQACADRDPSGTYSVLLTLDSAGRDSIARTTQAETGKRLGVFLNGELVCSLKIAVPERAPMIIIPGQFTRQEAELIAAGIEAAKASRRVKGSDEGH